MPPIQPLLHSPLVRLLAGWSATGTAPTAAADLALRWSQWLGALDTVRLQSALQAVSALPDGPVRAAPNAASLASATEALQSLQAQLTERLQQAHPLASDEQGFAPYRRRHQELQRAMASAIAPARAHLRQALARQPGRLRRLAALDAVLEPQLEGALQQTLARAIAHLQARHQRCPTSFLHDWRAALLAELDLRLQPLHGLLDAWHQAPSHPHEP